jgi:small subunit ribosomal protein S17
MAKTLTGIVVSTKMKNTVVVEVERRTPHKLYAKLMRRSKKYKVDPGENNVETGSFVRIEETRSMSKEKNFKIIEVLLKGGAK